MLKKTKKITGIEVEGKVWVAFNTTSPRKAKKLMDDLMVYLHQAIEDADGVLEEWGDEDSFFYFTTSKKSAFKARAVRE